MTHNSFYEHNSSLIESETSPFKKVPRISEPELLQMSNPKARIDPALHEGNHQKDEQPSIKDLEYQP